MTKLLVITTLATLALIIGAVFFPSNYENLLTPSIIVSILWIVTTTKWLYHRGQEGLFLTQEVLPFMVVIIGIIGSLGLMLAGFSFFTSIVTIFLVFLTSNLSGMFKYELA